MALINSLFLMLSIIIVNNASSQLISSDNGSLVGRTLIPFPPGRRPFLSNIFIRHYNGDSPETRNTYKIRSAASKLLADDYFDKNKRTVVYAHGYLEVETDESIQTVIQAYIENGGYNILLVDWSNLAFGDYVTSAANTESGGEEVGKMLKKLLEGGLSLKGLHLVGHSLGSHFIASSSRYLVKRGYNVPRLTGLDPAYPGFYLPLRFVSRMQPSDAQFVDVIHTDAGRNGAPSPTGTLDFWPNGGNPLQPGCPKIAAPLTPGDFCSHHYSWRFWAESLQGGHFPARQCDSYKQFTDGQCQGQVGYMGLQATPELSGNYYLRTNSQSPFSFGDDGAQPGSN